MQQNFEGFRLSPQQQRVWQLQAPGSAYCAQAAIALSGNLELATLQEAIEQVIGRHEILRTKFHCLPEMTFPLQVIAPPQTSTPNSPLLLEDWSRSSAQTQTAQLDARWLESRQQPCDLSQGPSIHLELIRQSAQHHTLLLRLSALCADTVTLYSLAQDIGKIYSAYVQGQNQDVDEVPLQYADFAEWQHELLEDETAQAGRQYWSRPQITCPSVARLPFEKQPTEHREFQPQVYPFTLSADLAERIQKLAQQSKTSISAIYLTCWQILLWRFTQQSNFIIGIGCEGRKYEELETALGLFSKTLPLPFSLEETTQFAAGLLQVQKSLDALYEWQEYFSWDVVAPLSTAQSTAQNSFFPFGFEFEVQPEPWTAADLTISMERLWVCTERFKVKLVCRQQVNAVTTAFHYDPHYFSAEAIQRLAGHFQTLLTSVLQFPDRTIGQLDLLTSAERQQLWVEFNPPIRQDVPDQNQWIHQLFEAQVAYNPDQTALLFEDVALTYAELNRQANQVAHYLRNLGVKTGDLVGLCVARSPLMAMGILGILKAGAAYVPLDPAYPPERLDYMLQDVQISVLLTQSQWGNATCPDLGSSGSSLQRVYLDEHWPAIAQQPSDNPSDPHSQTDLAYIICTSGSTGKPKGVRISHANLCHYVRAMQQALDIKATDIYLQTASIAFSSSVRQLMVPLCQGATVAIATTDQRTDPLMLFAAIQQHGVTVIDLVPSYWRNCIQRVMTLAEGARQTLLNNRLRLILSASEPLLADIPKRWREEVKHPAQMINMFGQTETSGIVAVYPIPQRLDERVSVVPLGQPIANTQIYLLDPYLQPVPLGVTGELYVGGGGVGQGYLNQPELTDARFIPHPFSKEKGDRLYKTGDLARYQPDGTLEFVSRMDNQVKLRGFRIELGEIEAVLNQHPTVREAAVVTRGDEPEQKFLAAYVVLSEQSADAIADLNRFLRSRLPDYMVPATIVTLEALPLTPNGKIDRPALPNPTLTQAPIDSAYQEPRSPVEAVLANLWGQLLHQPQVGIYDNFFELGGHSLLATQVMSQVRDAFQVELPLRSLFEAPTVAGLGDRIETLMQSGHGLADLLLQRGDRTGSIPLSFAQQRLWFLDQLDPGNAAYNLFRAVKLQGILNPIALEQSFNEILRRHEALRTSFVQIEDKTAQVIAAWVPFSVTVIDLSDLSQAQQHEELQQRAKVEAQQPFDLTKTPLMRATLLQLSSDSQVLFLALHHIVADGWSAGVLVRELAIFYDHFRQGQSASIEGAVLPELPIQYADFALWQQQWLQSGMLETQLAYWQQQLAGDLPLLDLPTDRPRPAIQSVKGSTQSWQISQSLTTSLKQLSQQAGVTLFMTLLTAFKVLLYRYTGQTDVLVGSPIANRNRTEIEGLIGFFVNTLVLRTDLSGNPSVQELLHRVRETTLSAYTHQDLPFEKLIEVLQPERSLSHSPLFQVMLGLQDDPLQDLALMGLDTRVLEIEQNTARFDLNLALRDTQHGISGTIEYNTDLFDASRICRMLAHYEILLASIVVNPNQKLSQLTVLSDLERYQILVEWNQTQVEYPQDQCLHQCFEVQAQLTPDAIALTFEQTSLTYQELDHRANQLAHYLQVLGVAPEVLVGICVERSVDMVVGLLGILKAGGAYVPLDPSYPAERLNFMLQDAQISVILTQRHLVTELPTSLSISCLAIDEINVTEYPTTPPLCHITLENLAYVIYTSGSTGQPKGVMNTHRGLCSHLYWMEQTFHLTADDRVLHKTPFSFDVSVWELFWPLLTGARLVIAQPGGHQDRSYLVEVIVQQKITTLHFVPSMLQAFLDGPGVERCTNLKRVICSGEALSPALEAQYFARMEADLYNLYGPTEAAIDVTYWLCQRQGKFDSATVPIGQPVANTQIYILDQEGHPVPIGVVGELHIGGEQLARGYLNRPELTAKAFIVNPFSDDPNARLYKTGDLARYRADGVIEYLGRLNYQVKVRGHRIELGEVETVLGQHPKVQGAIALVQTQLSQLIAYVVAAPSELLTAAELQSWLQQKLPVYMVPSIFVVLPAFPLMPNGKVDRQALQKLEPQSSAPNPSDTALHTPTEELLSAMWSQVLGLESVGRQDNFFALGGHSLLATQLISRIRAVFQVELPLQRLFETPTIAGLAISLDTALVQGENDGGVMPPPIQPTSRDRNLPLSFAQQRLWFLNQVEPDTATYNISAAVRLSGQLNIAALEQSIDALIKRHEVLRTTFTSAESQPIQIIHPESTFELAVTDILTIQQPELSDILLEAAQQPFDLALGPLFRVTLLRLNAADHVVLFVMHHIIADGWSMGVLIRELAVLYQAFLTGDPIPLTELPIQYADFAFWQHQWLQGKVLETKLAYWKQQLGAHLSVLQLPTDHPRETMPTSRGAIHSFCLSRQESEALAAFSRQENVTLFMTLLTTFQILLHRHTQQDDIVVGTDVANRNAVDIEGLIGFFVNLLVLRTDLSGNPSGREALQRVRSVALGAYAHQDVPFVKVVEALRPDRQLNAMPLFQVLFVLQNAPMPPLELSGLTLSQLDVDSGSARFDLALFLTETEQGLVGNWRYNAQLFEASTIARFSSHFEVLLESLYTQPESRIQALPMLSLTEQENQQIQQKERQKSRFQKFAQIKPQSISLNPDQLIQTSFLSPDGTFPLVIQPGIAQLDIADWAKAHRTFLERQLQQQGAILFRGVGITSATAFEALAAAICPRLYGEYGDLPRQDVGGKIYGSTPYPSDQAILFHSESSHLQCWPQKIWFCCLQLAQEGGETPIVDCRQVYRRLDGPLRKRFEQLQLMYVRNYIEGLDVSWQDFFHTRDRTVVEASCRQAGIDYEWLPENGLRTRQIRPAIAHHPQTNEPVFFNQIQLHHPACLESGVRESLLASFGSVNRLPRNVYYGDGSEIEDDVVQEILAIYQAVQVSFSWQLGDVLMLDNMLMAHGRNPYIGSRQVVVAMGDMMGSDALTVQPQEVNHVH